MSGVVVQISSFFDRFSNSLLENRRKFDQLSSEFGSLRTDLERIHYVNNLIDDVTFGETQTGKSNRISGALNNKAVELSTDNPSAALLLITRSILHAPVPAKNVPAPT